MLMNMRSDVKHLPQSLCFWSHSVTIQYLTGHVRHLNVFLQRIQQKAVYLGANSVQQDTGNL